MVTRDLDETVHFYRDRLGMQAGEVVDRTAQGAVSRHCFIKLGEAETWGLHFFESPDAEAHVAAGLDSESLLGTVGMQHIASPSQTKRLGSSCANACERPAWRPRP